jgi:magnesium-protoporphyrin IX monomethyl ester (oxidative) cyclase
MKILLIKPPALIPKDWTGLIGVVPPMGLAYVAAVLEQNGHEVKILDCILEDWKKTNEWNGKIKYLGLSYKQITNIIKKEKPDVVGITSWSVEAPSAFRVAKAVKKADKSIFTIFGGIHPSIRPIDCLSKPDVDFVVIGEGEYTTLELIKELEKKKPNFKNIKGIGFKQNKKIIINSPRPLIENLDELPLPARHLLDMEKYFKVTKSLQGVRQATERTAVVITSRGCPYNCCFCSIHSVYGWKWRPRSAENIVNEIKYLMETYNVTGIAFEDDNMTLDRKRAEKIFDLIEPLNIHWEAGNALRADTLDEKLLRKMKESGCAEVTISPESGDQEVLDKIVGKKLDLKSVENVVKLCKKIGLRVGCNFVIGMVGETKQNIKNTLEFANKLKKMGLDVCNCYIALPFYGTRLYEQAKKSNYLTVKDGEELEYSLLCQDSIIQTPEFTPKDLINFREQIIGTSQLSGIIRIIRSNPRVAINIFLLHPVYVTKYLLKHHLISHIRRK